MLSCLYPAKIQYWLRWKEIYRFFYLMLSFKNWKIIFSKREKESFFAPITTDGIIHHCMVKMDGLLEHYWASCFKLWVDCISGSTFLYDFFCAFFLINSLKNRFSLLWLMKNWSTFTVIYNNTSNIYIYIYICRLNIR